MARLAVIAGKGTLPVTLADSARSHGEEVVIIRIAGQADAIEALHFGLETTAPGQNVYVRGLTGTGRLKLVRHLLEEVQPSCPLAQDRCYVRNFDQPDSPALITLPRGRGRELGERVDARVPRIVLRLVEKVEDRRLRPRRAAGLFWRP